MGLVFVKYWNNSVVSYSRLEYCFFTLSTHANRLNSKEKSSTAELVVKRAKEIYGFTLKERSDENLAWMLQNGFLKRKRKKTGIRGRPLQEQL